ncbi:toll/interleukin-1 receptor domain-containing protein [Lentzea alba]|uniref:toll/interleukin-1 receptor domain-containing protein n=1 Tax=Lentzea alba TaxID=2714351 RepID=UPI0039BEE16A
MGRHHPLEGDHDQGRRRSPMYGKYVQPPSLIARFRLTDVVPADVAREVGVHPEVVSFGPWIGLAEQGPDVHLPLNNAFSTLFALEFQSRRSTLPPEAVATTGLREGKSPYRLLPRYFQRHRVLTADGIRTIEDYATAVRKGRRFFVSYRWRDFDDDPDWLPELTDHLTRSPASCWWDRRDIPQDVVAEIEKLLEDILRDAVRQAAFLVALMRPGYLEPSDDPGKPTWVRREWDNAGQEHERERRHGMTRVAVVFGDLPAARDWIDPRWDITINVAPDASPADVARRLIALLPE